MYTVEPLKTNTPRDRPKCPSLRGVRLIEVLKSIEIRQKELKVQLNCGREGFKKHKNLFTRAK